MRKIITFVFFISADAYAFPTKSLGELSDELLLPLSVLTSGLYNISLVVGIALLFGALIQYKNHRENPGQVLISRPITLLIFGVILIVLPILAKFSASSLLVSRVV
jgi:hypothetical protein